MPRRAQKHWIKSAPQDHFKREEAERTYSSLYENLVAEDADPPIGHGAAFWEHIVHCRHCFLVWESVCRRAEEKRRVKNRQGYHETFTPVPGFPSE